MCGALGRDLVQVLVSSVAFAAICCLSFSKSSRAASHLVSYSLSLTSIQDIVIEATELAAAFKMIIK